MTYNIPASLFTSYNEIIKQMNTNWFATSCQLVFPPSKVMCPNCIFDVNSNISANIYKSGGPVVFTNMICPYCNGIGYSETSQSMDVKMRAYFEKKQWIMINNLDIASIDVQTIGCIDILPSVNRCLYANICVDKSELINNSFILASKPVLIGLTKQEFIANWRIKN